MAKKLTNKQFFTKLAKEMDEDILMMMVVVDGLTKFADALVKADPDKITAKTNGMIDGHAWIDAGRRLKAKLDAQYAMPQG